MTEHRPSTESELVELVRSIDVRAPASLHAKVESLVAGSGGRAALRPRAGAGWGLTGARLAAAGALAAAITAVAITVGSSGGSGSTLSVGEAAALTLRPATQNAPRESTGDRMKLAAAVDGVSFPYWERIGWRSAGARSDRVGGRTVRTVFYVDHTGRRIGYAIVSGSPPPHASGGVVSWRQGTPYRVLHGKGGPVVVWLRSGHLCVVSGPGMNRATLLDLASRNDRRSAAA
jgi:hypothetical protein